MDVVTLKKAVKDAGKYTDQELDLHKLQLVSDLGGVHGLEIETGEWTPTLHNPTGDPFQVDVASGLYLRTGDKLECWFVFNSTVTMSSAYLLLRGLPIPPAVGFPQGHIGIATSPQGSAQAASVHRISYGFGGQGIIGPLAVADEAAYVSNSIRGHLSYLI